MNETGPHTEVAPGPHGVAEAPPRPAGAPALDAAQWGMIAFLFSEVAFFSTLIAVYLTFLGKDPVGPTPAQALSLPLVLVTTALLLSSSVTIHRAEKRLEAGNPSAFRAWWAATIGLGVLFLLGTAYEWRELIVRHHLTIGRNMFGTTYYTLVGFHGFHVTAGIVAMLVVLAVSGRVRASGGHQSAIKLVSWYWHFVDGVWVVVFAVVYLFGR